MVPLSSTSHLEVLLHEQANVERVLGLVFDNLVHQGPAHLEATLNHILGVFPGLHGVRRNSTCNRLIVVCASSGYHPDFCF